MNIFWIIVCALVIAAVAGLLPALLRPRRTIAERTHNQALHQTRLAELRRDVEDRIITEQELPGAQDEIDRALLEETDTSVLPHGHSSDVARWLTAAIILCGVPAIAFVTYLNLGEPQLATGVALVQQDAPEFDQKTIDEMIASLEQRLVDDPDSAEGWLLLGRSYMALNRYDDAVSALARAHELVGDVPQILLQYADALAMADGGRIGDAAMALVTRALQVEPENVTALWLAGLGAAAAGERGQALDYLRRARTLGASNGVSTVELDAAIHELERDAGAAPPSASATVASVSVSIDIDPALSSEVGSQDTLFVFARAPGQSGPPLAVTRTTAASLPTDVVLDETMAMAPMFKLQVGATVTVTARISTSGTPGAQAGDLQGTSDAFVVGESAVVNLVINEVVE